MNGKQAGSAFATIALTIGLLFFAWLLYLVEIRLGVGNGYSDYFRIVFVFITLSFIAGAIVGLTQIRNR